MTNDEIRMTNEALAAAGLGSLVIRASSFVIRNEHSQGFMENADVMQQVQQWANDILVWIGFGTVVGLLAKAIMPGRDPGGALTTLAMGIGGTIIGCGVLTYFSPTGTRVTPISLAGFAVATAGAFIILAFYRLLAGRLFHETVDGHGRRRMTISPRRTRRPVTTAVVYDDEIDHH